MAADGRVSLSSTNFSEENDDNSDSLASSSLPDTRHLKTTKSKFYWSGSFEELLDFAEKHLNINREMAKLSSNETKKTIKADHLILNWYESTGTLQLQGSQATWYKNFLNRMLLDAENETESHISRPSNDAIAVGSNGTEAVSHFEVGTHDDLRKEQFPAEVVPTSVFVKELEKIWTEIKSINNRFSTINQLSEGDTNNSDLINTLRQENQDLSQEIYMLKTRLQEERNLLNEITEERDSYRKTLQIMTKEFNTANTNQNNDIQTTRQQQQLQQQQKSHVDLTEANQVFDFIPTSQNR